MVRLERFIVSLNNDRWSVSQNYLGWPLKPDVMKHLPKIEFNGDALEKDKNLRNARISVCWIEKTVLDHFFCQKNRSMKVKERLISMKENVLKERMAVYLYWSNSATEWFKR